MVVVLKAATVAILLLVLLLLLVGVEAARMLLVQAMLEVPVVAVEQILVLAARVILLLHLRCKVTLVVMLQQHREVFGQVMAVAVAVQVAPVVAVKRHQQLAHKVAVVTGFSG
jgi:hypothetical protein